LDSVQDQRVFSKEKSRGNDLVVERIKENVYPGHVLLIQPGQASRVIHVNRTTEGLLIGKSPN